MSQKTELSWWPFVSCDSDGSRCTYSSSGLSPRVPHSNSPRVLRSNSPHSDSPRVLRSNNPHSDSPRVSHSNSPDGNSHRGLLGNSISFSGIVLQA